MQASVATPNRSVMSNENLMVDSVLANSETNASAVSWGAVLAGAAAAAALSMVLFILGFGLGLSAVSPWSDRGVTGSTIGITSIAWIAFTQIAASGIGGYLTGRLRVKWANVHSDEVYFRDTAHGLLAWAIASLLAAAVFGAAATATISGGLQAGGKIASGLGGVATQVVAANSGSNGSSNSSSSETSASVNPLNYFVDDLFRTDQPAAERKDNVTAEATRILAYSIRSGELSADDKRYLGQLVAQQTGIDQATAEKRVGDVYYQLTTTLAKAEMTAKEAADKARKSAAYSSLWMFIALLCGAFVASFSATCGGRQRDVLR